MDGKHWPLVFFFFDDTQDLSYRLVCVLSEYWIAILQFTDCSCRYTEPSGSQCLRIISFAKLRVTFMRQNDKQAATY